MKSAGDVDFPELIPDSRALLVSVWAITTSDEQDQLWSALHNKYFDIFLLPWSELVTSLLLTKVQCNVRNISEK